MPKIEIDLSPTHFELLQKVSEKLGLPIKTLLEQELNDALSNAEVWMERAQM